MLEYLKTADNVLTPSDLFKSLVCYVMSEHRPLIDIPQFSTNESFVDDNGEEIIQKILDNSNHQLRMYGTAKELAENLKVFRDFPFSSDYFESDYSLFFSSAVVYESLNGGKFISNMDILVIIQNMALKIFPESNSHYVRSNIMAPLRSHKCQTFTSFKFYEFDEKLLDELKAIEEEIREAAKSLSLSEAELRQFGKQFAAGNFTDFARKTHPKPNGNEAKIIEMINVFYKHLAFSNHGKDLFIVKNMIVAKCIYTILNNRPNLFTGNGVSFVRLFEDGSERFVMKSELFHAISQTKKNTFKEENGLFTTISMEDVERIYGNRVKNIEFIRTPIIRAKHRANLVKGHYPGEFGTLATDNLFDLLRDLIIGKQLFQKMLYPDWKHVSETFEVLFEKSFKPESKTPYFIRTESDIPIRFVFAQLMDRKNVRNAKVDGFTIQNLKNELVHLGLNRVFPEIGDHAESVYSAVDKIKKGQYLRTCDLFDAIYYCQLICVFDRVPKFKIFLHNQSGCGRVLGYNCEMCQKKKSEIQKTLELSSNESKGIESSENMKKEDTKMISFEEYEEMKMKILELENENRELKKDKSRSSMHIDNVKMDKLSIDSSIPTISTNNIISECLICELELKTTGDTLKCPMCRTRFHSKCAMEYVKHGVQCPSCKGTLQNSMVSSKF